MKRIRFVAVLLGLALTTVATRADVILQLFENKWDAIEHRMPDIFVCGYSALWTPPPGKADTGGGSVGYDVFNRFDLGTPASPTAYGTEAYFKSMVREAHCAGISIYSDIVLNHNGFRDNATPGFPNSGGYPGFAVTLPEDQYGDFHPPGASGRYELRLAGLIDIAQEKNWVYIRQPAVVAPNNLPNALVNIANRGLYPDLDLAANSLGIHPFNTADPMQGDPVAENATGVLLRHTQWMLDVVGVDGFRIDAAKHIPEWFFNSFFDNIVYQRGRPYYTGAPTTPYSFVEVFDGDYGLIGGYIRKDGFGNRDALDFPLYFAMQNALPGSGFGNVGDLIGNTIDASDGSATDGSRGVSFVSSHDRGPPTDDNLGYAFILTKTGYPIVYHNAGEFGFRPFPVAGRADALNTAAGALVPTLVDIHNEYARGFFFTRWSDADVLIYERDNALLVGINDNGDTSITRYDQRVVQTNFPAGTRLHELTGNAADPTVDPNNDIAEVLVVGGDQRVTIRVPRNINRRGYVAYGPQRPAGAVTLSPQAGTIAADGPSVPAARRRLTSVAVVTADVFQINLQTSDPDPLDPDDDDFAVFKIDGGGDYNGNGSIDELGGTSDGGEHFLTANSPRFGGGAGTYAQTINAVTAGLVEGYHYLKVIAYRHRSAGPPIFETWRVPFYVDRLPPQTVLDSPTNTGNPDVTQRFHRVKVRRLDRTASRVHLLVDRAIDTPTSELVAACNAGNQMSRIDLDNFEFIWNFIDSGCHTLFVVAFEDSGNVGVLRVADVDVQNGFGGGAGDINNDGLVNNFDIDPFVSVLTGGTFNFRADMDCDGRITNFDIDPFIARLTGS